MGGDKMYKKILAPLDGSELGECSLEHVKAIATGCSVPEVILLRVIEPLSAATVASLAEAGGNWVTAAENENRDQSKDYVAKMVKQLNREGLATKGETPYGRADEEILKYAEKNKVDLIIMSTHGRSGISRWAFGSVTDRVVRHSTIPVLIVTPAGCRTGQGESRKRA